MGQRREQKGSLPAEQRWAGGWGVMHASCSHAPFPLPLPSPRKAGDNGGGPRGCQPRWDAPLPAAQCLRGTKVGRGRGSCSAAESGEADPVLLHRANSSGHECCRGHRLTRAPQPRGAALAGPCPEPQPVGLLLPVPALRCRRAPGQLPTAQGCGRSSRTG